MPETDAIGVLTSTRPAVDDAIWVEIDQVAIERVAGELAGRQVEPVAWASPWHFSDGTHRTATWVFLLDALNFCFWSERPDPEDRWRVSWRGQRLDGYWALAAALTRGMDEGMPLHDPRYLAGMTATDLAHLLRPAEANGPRIPLFSNRLANVQELGRGLVDVGGGEQAAAQLIERSGGAATRLVEDVVRRFPSFNDVASYRGHQVRFYKRAQILVSDLAGAFQGEGSGSFTDIDQLTAFADYKVPQVLRQFGIMRYHPALAERIARRELIPAGSDEEIEIRAATIWGVERLRQALSAAGRSFTASDVDWLLWQAGQDLPPGTEPYHRTVTIYY